MNLEDLKIYNLAMVLGADIELLTKMLNSYIRSIGQAHEPVEAYNHAKNYDDQ